MTDATQFVDRLRWLAIAHIIVGLVVLVIWGIPGVLSIPRLLEFFDSLRNSSGQPAFLPFRPFIKLAFIAVILGSFVWGLLILAQGILLKLRRGFGACRVLAVISLPAVPLGSALGLLTLLLLAQPGARLAFEARPSSSVAR